MRSHRLFWLSAVVIGCLLESASAQTTVNPDISAIGNMHYVSRNNHGATLANTNNTAFEFRELELNFSGYLNPYARADVYVATHGVTGPVELEEVYASILRILPVQLRFGKYLVDFGRINTQHPHQWGWLDRPLMHRAFFGEDGAAVIGVQAKRLFGFFDNLVLTLSGNAFRSDFFGIDHTKDEGEEGPGEEGHAHGGEGPADIGYSGRAALFLTTTEKSYVELGGEYLWAVWDVHDDLTNQSVGADLKFRWRPDSYKGVNLIAETMVNEREVLSADSLATKETVSAFGAFAAAEVQFRKRYDIGAFYDWTEDPFDNRFETEAYGGYVGFMPVEDTIRFSLVYRSETSNFDHGSANSLTFQVLWALGPHKPHPF